VKFRVIKNPPLYSKLLIYRTKGQTRLLHPISGNFKNFREFREIFGKKFGGMNNNSYLCIEFNKSFSYGTDRIKTKQQNPKGNWIERSNGLFALFP
jgi:hypothetical protein